MIQSISVNQLKNISDAEIIDIRSIEKYNDRHILNARNIPFEQLLIYPNKYLNKYMTYYVYCQKGTKSKLLCQTLNKQGYNVISIIGGYEAWVLNE